MNTISHSEYIQLVNTIKRHDYLYWTANTPIISDTEYDKLYMKLADFESEYPELTLPDSPTQVISTAVNGNGRRTVRRRTIMLSCEKANDIEKVVKFMTSRTRTLQKLGVSTDYALSDYVAQWKFDGDSCSLVYQDGALIEASYGKGLDGADCLQHVQYVQGIPQHIDYTGRLEVRGEIVCPFGNLSPTGYKTCRSAASGYLNNQTPDPSIGRLMQFFAYWTDMPEPDAEGFLSTLVVLRDLGFDTGDLWLVGANWCDCTALLQDAECIRVNLPFPVDGIVIRHNEHSLWPLFGSTDHHPKSAIAYKFPAVQVEAVIDHIDQTVGEKTGKLTPVAYLQPITINGITVTRVSLGSERCMSDLGLQYGTTSTGTRVMLGLANDVIPHIYSTVID